VCPSHGVAVLAVLTWISSCATILCTDIDTQVRWAEDWLTIAAMNYGTTVSESLALSIPNRSSSHICSLCLLDEFYGAGGNMVNMMMASK